MLMPEEFYLATVLNQKVEGSCKINEHGLCRDFSYPNVSFYDVKWGAEHEGILGPGYRNDDVSRCFFFENSAVSSIDVKLKFCFTTWRNRNLNLPAIFFILIFV